MKLKIECTWNKKKESAEVIIHYDFLPRALFGMPQKELLQLIKLESECKKIGPEVLRDFELISQKRPDSLYAAVANYHALRFYQLHEEAEDAFEQMRMDFPKQVFTKTIEAEYLLENKDLDEFPQIFSGFEVLKPAFPKRKTFYFQEALSFHSVWAKYYYMQNNADKLKKHEKFLSLILNTLDTYLTQK